MTEQSTATAERPGWTVEAFEGFWSNPDPALVPAVLTEDVVGHWPGRDEPVKGRDAYTEALPKPIERRPPSRGVDPGCGAGRQSLEFTNLLARIGGRIPAAGT